MLAVLAERCMALPWLAATTERSEAVSSPAL